jgi:16S rRNA (guanine966-N2)-methyltransferase
MRIIAGRLKGRRLIGPSSGVRPTSDRLRETLFNVIRGRVVDARVMDVFAGTGAVGLEAVSRGARQATFVERDPRALDVLRRNVAACGAEKACAIIRGSFSAVFARFAASDRFDVIFLDPPYDADDLDETVASAAALLAPGGLLILEHSSRRLAPPAPSGMARRRDLVAGDSALAFYEPIPPPPN